MTPVLLPDGSWIWIKVLPLCRRCKKRSVPNEFTLCNICKGRSVK